MQYRNGLLCAPSYGSLHFMFYNMVDASPLSFNETAAISNGFPAALHGFGLCLHYFELIDYIVVFMVYLLPGTTEPMAKLCLFVSLHLSLCPKCVLHTAY